MITVVRQGLAAMREHSPSLICEQTGFPRSSE